MYNARKIFRFNRPVADDKKTKICGGRFARKRIEMADCIAAATLEGPVRKSSKTSISPVHQHRRRSLCSPVQRWKNHQAMERSNPRPRLSPRQENESQARRSRCNPVHQRWNLHPSLMEMKLYCKLWSVRETLASARATLPCFLGAQSERWMCNSTTTRSEAVLRSSRKWLASVPSFSCLKFRFKFSNGTFETSPLLLNLLLNHFLLLNYT